MSKSKHKKALVSEDLEDKIDTFEDFKARVFTVFLLTELSLRRFNAVKTSEELKVSRGTIRKYCGTLKSEMIANHQKLLLKTLKYESN